ncbi:MAG: alkaline phosphatase family protein [Proteobacteria bacterium]|nr:alkaline phosphatase family protein [Pseudomonadota bacterium]
MLKKLFQKKNKKVAVLGLDGVPYTLLVTMMNNGHMPHLEKIINQGTLTSMTASIPEVSSTSWSCFMTAVNPGKHGIYGFMEIDPDSYSFKFPNTNDLASKTLWEIAGGNGLKSIVINIPSTYPAKPLNGELVAGFVALDLKKACYPESMFTHLSGMGYRLDVDAGKAASSMDAFIEDLTLTFKKRKEAILHYLRKKDWDLFVGAITETDRLHHYLWEAWENCDHPRHAFFIDFYTELDTFIGDFHNLLDKQTPFIMLSDHGFTTIRQEVYLNRFLQEKGYLSFTSDSPRSFQDMAPQSTAFVLDPSRVYIHTKKRYSRGCVETSDYKQLCDCLKKDLLEFQIDGKQVIKEIFDARDLYIGRETHRAPDLVLLPHEGFDLKGKITERNLYGRGLLTGGHTRENAMLYINRQIPSGNPNITDVGATILDLLGILTADLDGKSLV